MTREKWLGAAIGLALATVLIAVYVLKARAPVTAPPPAPPVVAAPPAEVPPPEHYPVPEVESATAEPLPALADSDAPLRTALSGLPGAPSAAAFLVSEHLVANAVATLDSLTREPAPPRVQVIRPLPGALVVAGDGDALQLAPANAGRYGAFVAMVEAVDAQAAVQLYFRWYPLLQQAYVELGYPDRYLNDRVVQVIDHLLAAPEPDGPIRLVRPKVVYEFADADLEALSSGQKIMVRVGLDHERRLKARLRELRARLVAGAPPR